MMDRQKIFTYVKQKYGTDPDYPWFDTSAVLRHKDTRKWYGLVMEVQREKLKLPEGSMTDVIDVLNVKCDPMLVNSLRMQDGFHPAYHMNKERWITIRLDGSVPEATIRNLIDLSYELTAAKKVPIK